MTGRWVTGLSLAIAFGALLGASAQAANCDRRPGNPVNLQTKPLSSKSIELSWQNTTEKNSGDRHHMHFDIQVHDQNNKPATGADGKPLDVINGAYMANIKYMDRTSFALTNLKPDTVYRIAMRARDDDGCISEKPSEEITVRTISEQTDQACGEYANTFLVAYQQMYANHCSMLPPRWSPKRDDHLQFCFSNFAATQGETAARAKELDGCVHHFNAFDYDFKAWLGKKGVRNAQASDIVNTNGYGTTRPDEVVHLASLSKAITGLCIAKLVDGGLLAFTDKLSAHLNDYYFKNNPPADPAARDITIAELLRHTSGIGTDSIQGYNAANIPNNDAADVQFAKLALANKLVAKNYFYNDVNYALLGLVIKAIRPDHNYEEYCKKELFPGILGVTDHPRIGTGTRVMGAFGGWEMTTAAYARFIKREFVEKLGPKGRQFMTESETIKDASGNMVNYGLGVGVFKTAAGRRLQHFGNWARSSGTNETSPLEFSSYFALYDSLQVIVAAVPDQNAIGAKNHKTDAPEARAFATMVENALSEAGH